jgi:hypothetical protein
MIQSFIATYLLFARLVAQVVGNSEVLVIVAASFHLVDLIGTYSKVNVEDLLIFLFTNAGLDLLNIVIHVFGGHLYH